MKKWMDTYAGVTGFMHREHVNVAVAALEGTLPLMVGVLASEKTLSGATNSKPNRYPKREDIAGIFPEKSPRTLNLIHLGGIPVRTHLGAFMHIAESYGGENFQGFQLNVHLPDPGVLREWKARRRRSGQDACIVLQCRESVIEQGGRKPRAVVDLLAPYANVVDHILVDGSGGEGVPLDVDFCSDVLAEVARRRWKVGMGLAGGLTAETLETWLSKLALYFDFSIDAEGGLRDADDHLSMPAMLDYLGVARTLLGERVAA